MACDAESLMRYFFFSFLSGARGFGVGDHFAGDFGGHEIIVRKFHAVTGAALRDGR
jgi:hypothetical protein